MASQQPNTLPTAGRSQRQSQSNSITPQNRSGTASPNQRAAPTQLPSQPPSNNAWAQKSNGQKMEIENQLDDTKFQSLNGFNAADVRALLARNTGLTAYRLEMSDEASHRNSGGAWGSKAENMANNHPFFVQLAKQIATLEGGG